MHPQPCAWNSRVRRTCKYSAACWDLRVMTTRFVSGNRFFHYTHYSDEAGFPALQQQQKLMIDFPEYGTVSAYKWKKRRCCCCFSRSKSSGVNTNAQQCYSRASHLPSHLHNVWRILSSVGFHPGDPSHTLVL